MGKGVFSVSNWSKSSFLEELFFLLNKNEVKYAVLRNYDKLPKSTGGSDLDLLIHQKDLNLFWRILKEYKKKENLFLASYIPDRYAPKLCMVNSGSGIQIDVFKSSVFFGGKEIIPSSLLFKSIIEYNGVKVLKSELANLLSFLKEILNNKICKEKYTEQLQCQYGNEGIPRKYLKQFSAEFYNYLNDNLYELNEEDSLILYKFARRDFKKSALFRISYKLKRLFRHPGFTIAVLGTDGSGKSTIINKMKSPLGETFHNAVYYEHLRPNRFPSLAALFGREKETPGPVSNPHGSNPSGFWGSLMRWNYYMLDYTVGFFAKIWPRKATRSCVWIFDRYYYDYLIDPKRGRINLPEWLLKLGQFIIPEPDIIFCLGTDPQTIHNRKPELPLEEVERQVESLQTFCNRHPRAKWIDTGKEIDESAHDALSHCIEVMAKRFEQVNISQ